MMRMCHRPRININKIFEIVVLRMYKYTLIKIHEIVLNILEANNYMLNFCFMPDYSVSWV